MNIFILLTTLLISTSFAQTKALQSSLDNIREKYNLPALAAAVLQDGKIKEISAVGVRKIGDKTPVTTTDKFHIGSCSKSMTSTLVAIYIEKGKLRWDSTLPELFPELDIHPDYKNVTLEMILSHRSGMFRAFPTGDSDVDVSNRAMFTAHLLKAGPEFTPDTKDQYSNSAFVIAAHALERITNQSWETLIKKKLFKPLQMNSCNFGPTSSPEEKTPTQPWGHYQDMSKNGIIVPIQSDNFEGWGPAGRIHCNLKDWGKYLQIHLDGFNNKDSILSAHTIKRLQTIYPTSEMEYTPGAWFRLQRQWAEGTAFTHNGTNLINFARVWLAPKKDTAIMVVTNMGGDEKFKATDKTLEKTSEAVNEAVVSVIDLL